MALFGIETTIEELLVVLNNILRVCSLAQLQAVGHLGAERVERVYRLA